MSAGLRAPHAGARLLISSVFGLIIFLLAPARWQVPLRAESAWVAGVTLLLALGVLAIGDASPEHCQRRAQREDERGWVILAIIIAAVAVSLGALGMLLRKAGGPAETASLRAAVALLSVVASWFLTHTTFAFRYAHHYYGDPAGPETMRRGLAFPGRAAPDYWDFFYYAFVVGMTCQVSDVQATSRSMRLLTLGHSVLSFFFNAGVLALAVNILAGVL